MVRKSVKRFSEKDHAQSRIWSAMAIHPNPIALWTTVGSGAMAMPKKVVVAGATGLVGNAALRHFGASGGTEVIALSRRKPRDLYGARHVALDLTDAAQCTAAAPEFSGTTHLV